MFVWKEAQRIQKQDIFSTELNYYLNFARQTNIINTSRYQCKGAVYFMQKIFCTR